jgi:outer membrane protein assembly factor BamB
MRTISAITVLFTFVTLFPTMPVETNWTKNHSMATAATNQGRNWPQWRGPDGTGVSKETGLPAEWSATKNILWKTPIPGQGHSSPAVWGNHIFLTADIAGEVVAGAKAVLHLENGKEFKHPDSAGADRNHTLKVFCLDRRSGRMLWERTAYHGTVYDDRHRKGSYAAPTPATDGKHVYVWFGSEGLYCFDTQGKEIWKRSLGPIATLGMGSGTSPVLFENKVILLCDEDNGDKSFIVALDKNNGRTVWKTPRKVQASWATPLVTRLSRRPELICSGSEWILAYDPQTGQELWRVKGLQSNAIPSPLAGNGIAYVYAGFPVKKTIAIRLGGSGDLTGTSHILWQYERGTAYVPSGILYAGFLYLATDRGILTCLDAATGAVQYDNGRVPIPATFTASPVAFEGKILLTSEDGDTFIIKAGPKFELLATNSIGEPVYASPAISQGSIFLRGENHLYCISAVSP